MERNQLKEFCSECKEDLVQGDRVVLTEHLKFYHFYCYKRKNIVFRFLHGVKSFFIWQETCVAVGKQHKRDDEKETIKNEDIRAEGDNAEVHELQISAKKEENEVGCGESKLPATVSEESDTQKASDKLSLIDMNEITENLMQIIDEVDEIKNQINVFAAEKENDEKIIKHLETSILKYKKENMELKWLNNHLRDTENI